MFYPACPSSCLTLDGEIRRKNREESSPFLELTSARHTEAAGFRDFAGFRGQFLHSCTTTGVTRGLTDWLPAPLGP
jgi:hypothetical protein